MPPKTISEAVTQEKCRFASAHAHNNINNLFLVVLFNMDDTWSPAGPGGRRSPSRCQRRTRMRGGAREIQRAIFVRRTFFEYGLGGFPGDPFDGAASTPGIPNVMRWPR